MRPLFGDLLRYYRVAAEVTLTSLAHHLALKVPYLSDVERSLRPPLTRDRILKAAAFLSCGPELLLTAAARHAGVIPDFDFENETEVAIGTFILNIDNMTPAQWQEIAAIAGGETGNNVRPGGRVLPMPTRQKSQLKKPRGRPRERAHPDLEVSHAARPRARQKTAGGRD